MKIDSHHHFWDYSAEQYPWITDDKAVIRRDFTPADLVDVTKPSGIEGVVSVQARQSVEETKWLVGLANEHELVKGVVGWLPLANKDVRGMIEEWSHHEPLKGVRHVVQDETDDAFILGREFNEGVTHLKDYGFIYDILIFAKHLPNSIKFVDQHPEQRFVLDHIAKPTIRTGEFDAEWKKNILELGKRENVSCKFSGVATEVRDEEWNLETIQPYWDVSLEAFGSDRLMYGSDWPVCLLRTDYSRWIKSVDALASQLSASEQAQFWGKNASQAYSL